MRVSSIQGYLDTFQRYVDDASFFWILRSVAVKQAGYFPADIHELDERIDAQLDALALVPEESWLLCQEAAAIGQPGEIFTTGVMAFRSLDITKIQFAVEAGITSEQAMKGLASALAWLPGRLVHSWIKKFLNSKDLNHKYLALMALSMRREDPREYLQTIFDRDDCVAHEALYARALRLVGELKRYDMIPALRLGTLSKTPAINFWAHWSSILLGDYSAAEKLRTFVLTENPFQEQAIELVFHVLDPNMAREWITSLAKDPKHMRAAIKATAILGDAQAVPWLIAQMRVPLLSRLAGEAFTTITGIELDKNNLALDDLPELDDQLPPEEEDESVNMDEDLYLPFPDVDRVAAVWQKYQQRFIAGQHYFYGKTRDEGHLALILSEGSQRLRRKAAIMLALMKTRDFLVNVAEKRGESV